MKTPVKAFSKEYAMRELTTEENRNTRKEKSTHIAKMKTSTEVKEFEWRRKWKILPTRQRLAAWGTVPHDNVATARKQKH